MDQNSSGYGDTHEERVRELIETGVSIRRTGRPILAALREALMEAPARPYLIHVGGELFGDYRTTADRARQLGDACESGKPVTLSDWDPDGPQGPGWTEPRPIQPPHIAAYLASRGYDAEEIARVLDEARQFPGRYAYTADRYAWAVHEMPADRWLTGDSTAAEQAIAALRRRRAVMLRVTPR